jgi:hypothetical protein
VYSTRQFSAYSNSSTCHRCSLLFATRWYSDDHGRSFKLSDAPIASTNEGQIVELADGAALLTSLFGRRTQLHAASLASIQCSSRRRAAIARIISYSCYLIYLFFSNPHDSPLTAAGRMAHGHGCRGAKKTRLDATVPPGCPMSGCAKQFFHSQRPSGRLGAGCQQAQGPCTL